MEPGEPGPHAESTRRRSNEGLGAPVHYCGAIGCQSPNWRGRQKQESCPWSGPAGWQKKSMQGQRFQPVAAILALILPGLGYVALGEIRRAIYVGCGILGLVAGGLLIGGLDAIDSREDPLWYGVQVLAGPVVIGLDYVHQQHFKVVDSKGRRVTPLPAPAGATGSAPGSRRALARVSDVGLLYVALAGMLNLIAVIECSWHGQAAGEARPSKPPKVDRRKDAGVRIRRGGEGA